MRTPELREKPTVINPTVPIQHFIAAHREEILCRVRRVLELRGPPGLPARETARALPQDAVADAVAGLVGQLEAERSAEQVKRQGYFAHELRNYLGNAILAFDMMRGGAAGVPGSIAILDRSLRRLRDLVDRSVTEVRLMSGRCPRKRLHLAALVESIANDVSADAARRELEFNVVTVDAGLFVEADEVLFTSALFNLLQNAFKFTRPSSRVWLRVRVTAHRVAIEVEDECGGLPPGTTDEIFLPFEQRGSDRTGLGLGLTISRQAIEADGGTLSFRDQPGRGCVFIIDMPLGVPVAANGHHGHGRNEMSPS